MDPDQVVALYSPTGLSFLPTLSPSFIQNGVVARAYFVQLLLKTPEATITAEDIQSFGSNAYLHTGMYTFLLNADRAPVQARFSYMWQNTDNGWIITHHHSSVLPAPTTYSNALIAELVVHEH